MRLLVQKFGGTSVASKNARTLVYEKIRDALSDGWAVVAVVSAMGRKGDPYATDTLLDLFSDGRPLPYTREQDAIYSCGEIISGAVIANELQDKGIKCVFLNGGQAGIVTNEKYADASILTIRKEPIMRWIELGYVVLVAGGQGMTEQGDFSSIGRGGSDTTACAIGYYLNADEVRIYTDVDGIFTGDPRIIKQARPIPRISYEQCRRLAEYGAKVIHPRAVAYSQKGGRDVLSVRSTFTENPGTSIGAYEGGCIGVTALRNQMCFRLCPSERAVLDTLPQQAKPLLLEDGGLVHCCLSVDGREPPDLPGGGKVLDVIFAIGPQVRQALDRADIDRSLAEDIFCVDDSCAVAFVRSDNYAVLINQLHDALCIL